MEEFSCKTRVISGSGTIRMLGKLEKKRLFLVADPFFVKNGMADRVVVASGCREAEIFDRVQPDPMVDLAAEGTGKLREFAPDLLVGCSTHNPEEAAQALRHMSS